MIARLLFLLENDEGLTFIIYLEFDTSPAITMMNGQILEFLFTN